MIAAVLFGGDGCGNNFPANTGAGGHGGRGGTTGAAGGSGGGAAGTGGAVVDGGVAGGGRQRRCQRHGRDAGAAANPRCAAQCADERGIEVGRTPLQ